MRLLLTTQNYLQTRGIER